MSEINSKYHSTNVKRTLLVVEDEFINREMLRAILDGEYQLIFAETGQEAMDEIRTAAETLSLVLLDLNLPDMHGLDVLRPLLKQKRKSIKAENDYELNQKLVRFALSRGFTFDIIRQCLNVDEIDEYEEDF